MSTLKTSISILALATGLAIGLAPQASLAQSGGATQGIVNIKDYVEKQNADLAKIDKMIKPTPKPTPAPAPGTTTAGGTGGTSGFPPAPPPAPAAPSFWDKCVSTACGIWDALVGNEDEVAAQKKHNEEVHRLVEEKRKAEALKEAESKAAPKTETKKAEPAPSKTTETKTVRPEAPKTKTAEVKPVDTPKTKTETKITPVVIPNKAAPALIPAARTMPTVNVVKPAIAPTVAKAPVVTPVAAPVRPVTVPNTAAAVVSTTVGQVRIVTGPPVMTPRVPTPTISVPVRR